MKFLIGILCVCIFVVFIIFMCYAMARQMDEDDKEFTCPNCGKINRYAVFCRDCGTRILPNVKCPTCGLIGTGQYCGNCGTALKR